jgi:hypothetical protein
VREFPKCRLELIKVGGATFGRAVFEPGWRWAILSAADRRRAARHDAGVPEPHRQWLLRCQQARREDESIFRPVLTVTTREFGDAVEIRVRDNGVSVVGQRLPSFLGSRMSGAVA